MTNVVDFVPRARARTTQKPSNSSLVQEQMSATVHKLTSPSPVFHIYEERLTTQDIDAEEFFSILLSMGQVTIVNTSEEITFESRLRVEK